jgi:undecaprenyl phosphate-alpha-L-ara4N flippase subunit ArnE
MLEAIFILLFSIVSGAVGQIFFKRGTKTLAPLERYSIGYLFSFFKSAFLQPFIWLGVIAMTLNFFSWLLLLSRADVSWALPMRSIQYILVALFALIFLKEAVKRERWLGIGFITCGIFFMLRSWGG